MPFFEISDDFRCVEHFTHVDGLNIIDKPFENDTRVACNLYFHDYEFISTNDQSTQSISKKNAVELLTYLIGKNITIEHDYVLRYASECNDLALVKYLVEKEIILFGNDYNCVTSYAAENGDLELLKFLAEKQGVDFGMDYVALEFAEKGINFMKDNNPLELASKNGHLAVVKFLVEFRETSNNYRVRYKTLRNDLRDSIDCAFRWASVNGHLEVVKYLAEKGAYIGKDLDYALRFASKRGHLEVVKFLVENGANVRSIDDYALRFASGNGHLEVVKFLAEKGANVRNVNDYAIRFAFEYGHFEVVKFLVEKGADIGSIDASKVNQASEKYQAQHAHTFIQ